MKYDSNQVRLKFSGILFPFMFNLEVYNVTGNQIEGIIGWQISFCKNLTYIGMGHNNFDSTLPTHLGLLSKLTELDVSENANLGSSIPSEIGSLSTLTKFDVSGTSLTGRVPEGLCGRARDGALEVMANCSQIQCCS